jgi:hypothetical protein
VISIHHLANYQLSCGIDQRLGNEIYSKAKNPYYLPLIANNFLDIVTVFSKFKRAHLLRNLLITVFLADLNEFCVKVMYNLSHILPLLIVENNDLDKRVLDTDNEFKETIIRRMSELW